jgi:hypothetical protein
MFKGIVRPEKRGVETREWYHSNRHDFAYNRQCFLGALNGLLYNRCSALNPKNQFERLGPKRGVFFRGLAGAKLVLTCV